jgi:ribosomal protein S18 acetylase RimI-like enzyme
MNDTISPSAHGLGTAAVRRHLAAEDREPLARLLEATGFFNPEELEVALELVDDRLVHGEASHYRFLVAEADGRVAGYACWGPIPGTVSSVDLYWIAVDPAVQGRGVGRALLVASEAWIAEEGRSRIYIETSSRGQYHSTRGFYLACGYSIVAELDDFYAPRDGKVIYLKVLAA